MTLLAPESMFGLVILAAIVVSGTYAIIRTVYERFREASQTEPSGTMIPFASAVRLANKVSQDRMVAESPTVTIVPALLGDGLVASPEPAHQPGAATVDVSHRRATGRHRGSERNQAAVG